MKYCPICKQCYDDVDLRCIEDDLFLVEVFAGPRTIEGKYRIDLLLGQGGMGSVYQATHLELDRVIALKIVSSDFVSNQETIERFRQEARAAARLNHPNVINVYDFGVLKTGQAYLAMELLKGHSLRDEMRASGKLSPQRVLEIIQPVCNAVHLAHKAGVIHRDLKPDNIVIEVTELKNELVKVVDFGIAKLKEYKGNQSLNLTEPGLVMGTPHYMSPEQCRGEELDARSDIYSLGITIYEMLTGQVPFDAATPSAVIIQHAVDPPRKIRLLCQDISENLERVVMKSLMKNRESRQQSTLELIHEFQEAININNSSERSETKEKDQPSIVNISKKISDITTGKSQIRYQFNLKQIAALQYHEHVIKSLGFSTDGAKLLSASKDGTVRLWNVDTKKEERNFGNHKFSVNTAAFSTDGLQIASAETDGTVRIWTLKNGQEVASLPHNGTVRTLAFAPDRQWLAVACDVDIKIWDVSRYRLITSLEGHTKTVESIAFSLDGNKLASGSADDTICIWNMITKTQEQRFFKTGHAVTAVCYLENSRYLASGGRDNLVCIWNVENPSEPEFIFSSRNEAVRSLVYLPQKNLLLSGDWNGYLSIWDLRSQSLILCNQIHDGAIFALCFNPSGNILASGGDDTIIKMWEIIHQ